jgi:hypothetical protein
MAVNMTKDEGYTNAHSKGADTNDGVAQEEVIKAEAKKAVQKLEACEQDSIPVHLDVGRALQDAKDKLPHGKFGPFLRDDLKKSASWASLQMRFYEAREDLEPARAWAAAINHPLSTSYSVEGFLKLVRAYKAANKPAMNKESGAKLLHDLQQVTDEFVAAVLLQADDDLADTTRRFQLTVRALVEQTCSALQVSRPGPDATVVADRVAEKADNGRSLIAAEGE